MAVTQAGERECRCFRAVTVAADFAVLELSIEENVLNGKRAGEHDAGNSLFVGNSPAVASSPVNAFVQSLRQRLGDFVGLNEAF